MSNGRGPLDGGGTHVLIVEDEESYRDAMSSGLQLAGYRVESAVDGLDGLRRFVERPPDVVLLDLLLPGMSGVDVCRKMLAIAPVPVLMVSAVDAELDVVLGLELGAAGYVTKPFRLRELVARIEAVLRRVPPTAPLAGRTPGQRMPPPDIASEPETPEEHALGSVIVNLASRCVTKDGEPVHLSRREFDLLAVLLSLPGKVHTRDALIDLLWSHRDLPDSRTLDTHIRRLRSKLEHDPANPRLIVTVRGVGFRIDPDAMRPSSTGWSTGDDPQ